MKPVHEITTPGGQVIVGEIGTETKHSMKIHNPATVQMVEANKLTLVKLGDGSPLEIRFPQNLMVREIKPGSKQFSMYKQVTTGIITPVKPELVS